MCFLIKEVICGFSVLLEESQSGGIPPTSWQMFSLQIMAEGLVASSEGLIFPDSPAKLCLPISLFPLAVPAERGNTKDSGLISLDGSFSKDSWEVPTRASMKKRKLLPQNGRP